MQGTDVYFLIGNLTSTSVMSMMCSSEIVSRRWRIWIHDELPPPSWASSRGEHLHRTLQKLKALILQSLQPVRKTR